MTGLRVVDPPDDDDGDAVAPQADWTPVDLRAALARRDADPAW
jgi:hypothetical protein